ncbi:hypothetical protein SAY86_007161 [Trapa natans]|uniref:Uncharacterized protein n=1 Tax=Trapa natans TaxID=22666 RepID=A0AAN7LAC7_TRANT|nr:hypothetical protein SAY86_007161 [Trapa natans]
MSALVAPTSLRPGRRTCAVVLKVKAPAAAHRNGRLPVDLVAVLDRKLLHERYQASCDEMCHATAHIFLLRC